MLIKRLTRTWDTVDAGGNNRDILYLARRRDFTIIRISNLMASIVEICTGPVDLPVK